MQPYDSCIPYLHHSQMQPPIHDKILMPQNQKVGFEAFLFKKYTNLLVRDTNLIAKLLNLFINTKLFCLILTKKMVLR